MFDNDVGGQDGIKRVMKLSKDHYFESFDIRYIPVHLPIGKDPDKLLRAEGVGGMKNILAKAKDEVKFWS